MSFFRNLQCLWEGRTCTHSPTIIPFSLLCLKALPCAALLYTAPGSMEWIRHATRDQELHTAGRFGAYSPIHSGSPGVFLPLRVVGPRPASHSSAILACQAASDNCAAPSLSSRSRSTINEVLLCEKSLITRYALRRPQ